MQRSNETDIRGTTAIENGYGAYTQDHNSNYVSLLSYRTSLQKLHLTEGSDRKKQVSAKAIKEIIDAHKCLSPKDLLASNPSDKDRTIFHYLLSAIYDDDFIALFNVLFQSARENHYNILNYKLSAEHNGTPADPLQYAILWNYEQYAFLLVDMLLRYSFSMMTLSQISSSLITSVNSALATISTSKNEFSYQLARTSFQICARLAIFIIEKVLDSCYIRFNQKEQQEFTYLLKMFVNNSLVEPEQLNNILKEAIARAYQQENVVALKKLLELWISSTDTNKMIQELEKNGESGKKIAENILRLSRIIKSGVDQESLAKVLAGLFNNNLVNVDLDQKEEPFLHHVIGFISDNPAFSKSFIEALDVDVFKKIDQVMNKSKDNSLLAAAYYNNIEIIKSILSRNLVSIYYKNRYDSNVLGKFFRNQNNITLSKLKDFLKVFQNDLFKLLLIKEGTPLVTSIERFIDCAKDNRTFTLQGIEFILNSVGVDERKLCERPIRNDNFLLELIINALALSEDDFLESNDYKTVRPIFLRVIKNTGKNVAIDILQRTHKNSYIKYINEAFSEEKQTMSTNKEKRTLEPNKIFKEKVFKKSKPNIDPEVEKKTNQICRKYEQENESLIEKNCTLEAELKNAKESNMLQESSIIKNQSRIRSLESDLETIKLEKEEQQQTIGNLRAELTEAKKCAQEITNNYTKLAERLSLAEQDKNKLHMKRDQLLAEIAVLVSQAEAQKPLSQSSHYLSALQNAQEVIQNRNFTNQPPQRVALPMPQFLNTQYRLPTSIQNAQEVTQNRNLTNLQPAQEVTFHVPQYTSYTQNDFPNLASVQTAQEFNQNRNLTNLQQAQGVAFFPSRFINYSPNDFPTNINRMQKPK